MNYELGTMNYKITHIIEALHWKIALLVVFMVLGGQSVWAQYYRFEYLGGLNCSGQTMYLTGFTGDSYNTTGSFDLPIGSSDIVSVSMCGQNYGSPTQYGDCWSVAGVFKIYPVIKDILKNNSLERNLPTIERIYIQNQYPNFPTNGDYNYYLSWFYSLDGISNWQEIATNVPQLYVSASDIFPADEVNKHINEYVYFKAKYNCDCQNDLYSDAVQYKIVRSAPTVTPKAISPTCVGDKGTVSISIGRDLYPNETLILNLIEKGYEDNIKYKTFSGIIKDKLYDCGWETETNHTYTIRYTSILGQCNDPEVPSTAPSTNEFSFTNPTLVKLTAKHTDITCNGSKNGTITLSATGGTGDYNYSIEGIGTGSFSDKSNAVITITTPNTYKVVVTDLKGGCLAVKDVNSKDDPAAIVVTQPTAINVIVGQKNNTCYGVNGGSITLSASGGSCDPGLNNYKYEVTANGGYSSSGSFTENEQVTLPNLYSKTYQVSLTDKKTGCIANSWSGSSNSSEIIITDQLSAINAVVSKGDNTCYGDKAGSITLSASGGSGNYNYTITADEYSNSGSFTKDKPVTFQDLYSKTYQINLTDNVSSCPVNSWSGPIINNQIQINDQLSAINAVVSKGDNTCYGDKAGSITLSASGGSGNYNYTITADEYSNSGSFTKDKPVTFQDLYSKTYQINLTDNVSSCPVNSWSGPIINNQIQINDQLQAINATISKKGPSCDGAELSSITLQATGGSGSYKYVVLKNGGSYKSGSFSEKLDISNPPEGTYSVALTDEIGDCPVTTWKGVADHSSFQIIKPKPITIESTDIAGIDCYGDVNGAITVHAKGGVGTLNYNWSGDRVAENTNTITGLGAGTYTVTISDATTCPIHQTYILKSKYTQIIPTLKATNVSCFGKGDGKVEVTGITGGTGSYTCEWRNNADEHVADGLVATNLSPGSYYVIITDDARCTAKSSPVNVTQLDPLTVTLTGHDPDGYGRGNGSITAEVKDGNGGNEYVWTGTDFEGTKFTSTETSVSGLKAGNYSLTVTDKNLCTATATVSIDQPNPLVVNMEVTHPVSCHNGSDGTLKATASGGVKQAEGTYTYTWKKINADNTYSPISSGTSDCLSVSGSAGDYMVEVEDAHKNELKSANTITLINPEPLAISTQSITDVNCYDNYTGEIHFTVMGGSGSYTYWNDKGESISNDLTGLHAGKHTVKIKDAYCELDHEFIVSQPSAPLSVTFAKKELSAYHASDAELVATVSGGTFSPDKPCSFDWTGSGSKTKTASGLASGTYKLKVTDHNGCTAEDSATFIDPLKVDIVVKDTIRCNGSLGQLAARAVGGEPSLIGLPYEYTWYKHNIKTGVSTLLYPLDDLKQSDDSVKTLLEGYYSVKIDDSHGRILQTAPFHLAQPDTIKFRVDSMNVSCKGDNNGSIRVTATGGSGLYKYLWNNGSRSSERTDLPPGNYTVEVSDSLFVCAAVPASRTISITEPDKLTLNLQKRDVLVACDGEIEAIVAGGTRPYRFRWNDGEETVDSVKTQLCDGNYKLEVIDKNLCTATASILLPPPLVVKISVQDSVKCFGDNNGSLVVHAQGGVPYKIGKPYSYSWKKQNTSGMYEELTVEKDSVSGLTAGWYALNITDSIGVTLRADSVFYLPQPEALAIRIQKTDVLCHGASTGAISAVVTGGLKPYSLLWNTGSTDAELQNIKAGVYTITATDRNGCTKQYTATIDQSDSLIIGFTNTVAPLSAGSCDGSLTAAVLGGIGPYTYQWSPNNTSGATADVLCRSSYTVTVNDMFGCPAQVTKNLNDAPPPFVVSLYVKDSIQCHGTAAGKIVARVAGGIPFTTGNPYLYIWKKKNSVGEYRSIANSNDSIVANLTTGWYTFNVQDADKNILYESIEIYLPEPDTLALTVGHTDIPCKDLHNGSASVHVSGGVLPYAYKWSNGETTPTIDKLAPGEYSIEVTDKHGCISRQSVTVTEPELLAVTFQPKLISEHNVCDGSLKAAVTGGTAPFSYAWSGVNSTADAVSSLCAADYSVTVTDAHGCSANQKITLSNPPALRLSLVVQDSIKCNGNVQGVLVATAHGGIPFASNKKYRYTWKKKNSRGVFETMSAYTDSIASDLATGTYACNITDANGISLHQDSIILLPEPTELQLAIQQTNIGCSGAAEGTASVIPSGGSLPYAYAWSTGDKAATVRNLSAGPYIVRVTDRNGCVAARQIYISKASPLYLFLYKKQPLCYQSCDGTISTTVSGGIAPYSFQWTGSASAGSEAGSLCAGKYSLLVTDAVGCTIQKKDSLQNPAQLALDLGANRYICSGQTIRYDISIPSKTGISYSWVGPDGFTATTPTVDLTKPGIYTASVTNAAGCSNSGTVTLTPSGTTVANEFALPTQAFVNEKVVIVNTTYPSPDSIRWVLPAKAQILSYGQSYTEFQVADTGVYVIKMISYKGVCSSEQEKEMIVSTRSQLSDIGNAKTPFIQTFSVTPNPSHGNLATKIVLQDKADIQLKLINILSNHTAFQVRKSGDSTYEIPINVTVLSGTYLLLLETPKGSATMKVIIF